MRFICVLLAFFAIAAAAEDYKYLPDIYMGNTAIFKPFATAVYKGKKADIKIDETTDVPVNINFAGKYYINDYSCMTERRPTCRSLRMVDLSNANNMIDLDDYIIDYDDPIKEQIAFIFQRSYTLLIAMYQVWLDEDTMADYKTVYYDFKDGKFNEIKRAFVYPNDVIKYMEQRASCDHLRGEIDGESDDIYKADLEKYCGGIEQTLANLKERYAKKREIVKLLNGYGYYNR